jgi:hypothetical protein
MPNPRIIDMGLEAGQIIVAEEVHGLGWIVVSSLNPR